MDDIICSHFEDIRSKDKETQNQAYYALIELTEQAVDWAYDVWDELVALLTDKDNHLRSIASQLLCNLAKSDPENRMQDDFPALLAVTKDERFVTARHCLQNIWKVGLAGDAQKQLMLDGLEQRYHECVSEKNMTLIRFDIIQGLRNLYDALDDDLIKEKSLALIELEEDVKYRKKYAKVWKDS